MLSFIIPAHDEAAVIASAVNSVRSAAAVLAGPFEVIVVDDASADSTGAIAAAAGARVVKASVRQIAGARNAGAAAAKGEMLVFVDADTLVSAQVVRAAIEAMKSGAVGGGATVRFDEPVPGYVRLLWRFASWIGRLLGWSPGCFMFCTREAFDAVGGFDARFYAGEEIALSRALGKRGRFVILRESVLTSGRKMRTHSAWEIVGAFLAVALGGMGALRDRNRLGLWYGPRRKDPA